MTRRVCFILPRLKIAANGSLIGGAQNSALGLLKEIREAGFSTSLIAGVPPDSREAVRNGVLDEYAETSYTIDLPRNSPVIYGTLFAARMSALIWDKRHLLSEVDTFHIHAGYHHYGICAFPIKAILGKPVLFSIYCPLSLKVYNTEMRFLNTATNWLSFAGVSKVIATSTNICRSLEEAGVQRPKVETILPLPNLSTFYHISGNSEQKTKVQTRLLFVGNTSHSKGLDVLLEALERLNDLADWKLDLLVENEEKTQSENARRTKSLAVSLGIENRIERHGIVPVIGDYYEKSDIVVIPYRDTAGPSDYPLVLLEAMAAGRCVVASRVGGIPEVVESGVSGVLVSPSDPVSLEKEIRLMLSDHARRAEIGRQARMRISQLFDKRKIIQNYIKLIGEIAS